MEGAVARVLTDHPVLIFLSPTLSYHPNSPSPTTIRKLPFGRRSDTALMLKTPSL